MAPSVLYVIVEFGLPMDVAAWQQLESTDWASINSRRSGMSVPVSSTLSGSANSSGRYALNYCSDGSS